MLKLIKNIFKKKYKSTSVVPKELYIDPFKFKPIGRFKHDIKYYDDDIFLYYHNITRSHITNEFIDKFETYVEEKIWYYLHNNIESVTFGKVYRVKTESQKDFICFNYKNLFYDNDLSHYYPNSYFNPSQNFVKHILEECQFGSIFQAQGYITEVCNRYFKG